MEDNLIGTRTLPTPEVRGPVLGCHGVNKSLGSPAENLRKGTRVRNLDHVTIVPSGSGLRLPVRKVVDAGAEGSEALQVSTECQKALIRVHRLCKPPWRRRIAASTHGFRRPQSPPTAP